MNLATAYADRIRGERAENLEAAIAAYAQALTVMTRQAMPIEWAQTTMNLANAYYSRIRGERAENLEAAIAAYAQALEIFQPTVLPDECRRTARSLGGVYAASGRWREAMLAYDQAVQAAEALYLASASQFSKEAELSTNGDLYRRSAFALAHDGSNLRRAVEVLEQGRARGLGETLDRDHADLVALQQVYPDLAAQYLTAA